jgi:MoaA/NifB/PqqE/SkfB family radical SAM enzyme
LGKLQKLVYTVKKKGFSKETANIIMYGVQKNVLNFPEQSLSYPTNAHVEVTSRCNLKCLMCPRAVPDEKLGNMSIAQFTKILDDIPYLQNVSLQGLGEPTLSPHFFDFVRICKERNITSTTVSNATIYTEELAKNLATCGLAQINISIDGATKETYEAIRVGAKWEAMLANARKVIQYRNESGSKTRIHMSGVLMKSNYHELPQFVQLAHDIGFDELRFWHVNYGWNTNISNPGESLLFIHDDPAVDEKIKEATALAQKLGLRLVLPKMKIDKIACGWPWHSVYITWDGNIAPCSVMYDTFFGNMFKEPFEKIWNNPSYVMFRRNLKKTTEWATEQTAGQEPPLGVIRDCIGCTFQRCEFYSASEGKGPSPVATYEA